MEIPIWVKNTKFQCDATQQEYYYDDLFVVWYDKVEAKGTITIEHCDRFMLVKQDEGFKRIPRRVDDWTLSSVKLESVYTDNVVVFFTAFLVVDSLHDNGTFKRSVNIDSWNRLFRRLTVPYFEQARHRLHEAKQMDDFRECTESQLLTDNVLSKFVKQAFE